MIESDWRNDAAALSRIEDDLDADRMESGELGIDEEGGLGAWWASLPDFINPTYPFDLPPDRLPFAQRIFTLCGAPARCAQQGCRRTMQCAGTDGPPCFRADRKPLQQILFLAWMAVMGPATDEQGEEALRRAGNPYRWPFAVWTPDPRNARRRRRKASVVSRGRSP